ncbi:MAG: alpha/beta fold hydrolase [Desulfuromonas sp.]|nr:alpha/beta fold hydrolase [Desulfuromonas sp.]
MDILYLLPLTFIGFAAFFSLLNVTLSYLLFWYELANLHPEKIDERFKFKTLKRAALVYCSEYCCCFLSCILYPFGWLPSFSTSRTPRGPVVLLLHGLYQSRASCFYLQLRLRQQGFTVLSINLPPWKEIENLTECVDRKINELHQQGYSGPIDIVGHSMGGIIARNYIQRRGGARHIRHCVTLGAPHCGTKLIPFAVTRLARHLSPKSTFIEQLSQSDWPQSVSFTSIYSETDNIVLPPGCSKHPQANNHAIDLCGHIALLYHPQCFQRVRQTLIEAAHHDHRD